MARKIEYLYGRTIHYTVGRDQKGWNHRSKRLVPALDADFVTGTCCVRRCATARLVQDDPQARSAVFIENQELHVRRRIRFPHLPTAQHLEQALVLREIRYFGRDGVPGNVTSASHGSKVRTDSVPIRVLCDLFRRADASQPAGIGSDHAFISNGKVECRARFNSLRQGHNRF